jgi:2-C-methyl-D-erythritol 2,4-cyclodiphosphate synthase/2-C-methyl-D-erythritol 4-phosphate cytidylyltransferase
MGTALPKQYLPLAGSTVIEQALRPFLDDARLRGAVIALAPDDTHWPRLGIAGDPRIATVIGGADRAASVRAALAALAGRAQPDDWVLVHDAARPCLGSADRDLLLEVCRQDPVGGLLAVPLGDTLKRDQAGTVTTLPRDDLWRALTPQMFRYGPLSAALRAAEAQGLRVTDEASAFELQGQRPRLVEGSPLNIKVTRPADLEFATAVLASATVAPLQSRVGFGYDVHAFGPGDHVMLGGVRLPHSQGVVAHSDGDVLLHALCDALLGAAGLDDIGVHFSDSDARWSNVSSLIFVQQVMELLREREFEVVNADLTLLAEAPRLGSQRAAIVASVATALGVERACVNLKATTMERLGAIGRREGLAAQAVVLLQRRAHGALP